MPLREFEVRGYRSLRDIHVRLSPVTVIVGPNGCGKSNLYRALQLVSEAALGRLGAGIAREGGMESALWAGERRRGKPVRLEICCSTEAHRYELVLGLPVPDSTPFELDPQVKSELISVRSGNSWLPVLERGLTQCTYRDASGRRQTFSERLDHSESVLSQMLDAERFPVLFQVRKEILSWRFYHAFRTDQESPLRRQPTLIWSPVLNDEGDNLFAAIKTLCWQGRERDFMQSLSDAFPGATMDVDEAEELELQLPEFQRPFRASELSDGTLRYIALCAALLSARPASLIALNEPETSLHADLIPSLGRLIACAATQSGLWVTTHSDALAQGISAHVHSRTVRLEKVDGETRVVGASLLGMPEEDEE